MKHPSRLLQFLLACAAGVAAPALAETYRVDGFDGNAGATGGTGDNGTDAVASRYFNGNDGKSEAHGGNGGAGGEGRFDMPAASDRGGNGGAGGNAVAEAYTFRPAGPVSAVAEAYAGLGGAGGLGGLDPSTQTRGPSGAAGFDGQARARAEAGNTDAAAVAASAYAIGAQAVASAYGYSNGGGTVTVSATAVSRGAVWLSDAVDGSTSGRLNLVQHAIARTTANPYDASAGTAFSFMTQSRYGSSAVNATVTATGADGGPELAYNGGSAIVAGNFSTDCAVSLDLAATAGHGSADASNAYWGGTAQLQSTLFSNSADAPVSFRGRATGGNGADALAANNGGLPAFGGTAGAAVNVGNAGAGNVEVDLTIAPGSGGAARGVNQWGGQAGYADLGPVSAQSQTGKVSLAVTLLAGNGGGGFDGAAAADGGDATLNNIGQAQTRGDVSIHQTAVAGNGGAVQSDEGPAVAGNGGNAYSTLAPSAEDHARVNYTAAATGGNGGDADGAAAFFTGGKAGAGSALIEGAASRSIRATAVSTGGDAGRDHGVARQAGGAAESRVVIYSNGAGSAGDEAAAISTAHGGVGYTRGVDDPQGSARAIAESSAAGSAGATAQATAVGGAAAGGGLGASAYAIGTASLSGTGTTLRATATAIGGNGDAADAYYTVGGIAIAEASVKQPWGSATATATGGDALVSGFGGAANAIARLGDVYVVQGSGAIGSTGAKASVTFSNGSFTALTSAHANLGISGAAAVRTARLREVGTLTVISGATLQVDSGGGVNEIDQLEFFSGGKFDLADNSLVLHNPYGWMTLTDLRGQLAAGQLFSAAADAAHTLGYGSGSALNLTTLGGVSVGSGAMVVRYALSGDANLDGKVDVTDLGALASRWQQAGVWTGGDFNYDGTVNVVDLGLLATHWQAGVNSGGMSFDAALARVNLDAAAVPEPAAAVLLLSAALASRRRRRAGDAK